MRLRQGIAAGMVIATGLVVPAGTANAAPAAAKKCDTEAENRDYLWILVGHE